MTEADAAELEDLRAKAYGPDGELTEAEARRLDELQALAGGIMPERSAPKTVDADEPPTPSGDESPRNGSDASGTEDEDSSSDEDACAEAGTISEPGRFRGIRKRRWFPYVALGLTLVLGFGIGFALFGQDAVRSIALSLRVGAEQVALETAGEYDPGTVRPLEQAHDVTIWHATRDARRRRGAVRRRHGRGWSSEGVHLDDRVRGARRGPQRLVPAHVRRRDRDTRHQREHRRRCGR